MELIVACVYCGVSRFVSISDYCYTDVTADTLILPDSPMDVARKHYWFETQVRNDVYGTGDE